MSYTLTKDGGIKCWTCGLTSYHPKDVENRFCGHCNKFHDLGDRPMYYHRDGTPYLGTPGDPRGTLAWGKDFEDMKLRKIARTKVPGGFVSTVWLGLDHSFGDGPPLIFESMFFGKNGGEDQERYSTEAEAIAGHKRMVKKYST